MSKKHKAKPKPNPTPEQVLEMHEDGSVTSPPATAVGAGHVASTAAVTPPAVAFPTERPERPGRRPVKNPPRLLELERETRDPDKTFLRRQPPEHLVATFKAAPALVVGDELDEQSGARRALYSGAWRVVAVRARTSNCQVVVLVAADAKVDR